MNKASASLKILVSLLVVAQVIEATVYPTGTPTATPPPKCNCIHDVRCFVDLAHCQMGHPAVTLGYGSRLQCLNANPAYTVYDCWEEVVNGVGVCRDVETCNVVGGGKQDPHFKGFDGSDYYFDGVSGRDYNVITDASFQLNARFIRLHGLKGTYMGRLGFRFGEHTLLFDSYFGVFFNGSILSTSVIELPEATIDFTVTGSSYKLIIHTDVYHISARNVVEKSQRAETYINMEASLNGIPIDPHGILGQTARNNGERVQLDLNEASFLVDDGIFGVDFPVNRFKMEKQHPLFAKAALAARTARKVQMFAAVDA